MLKIIVTVLVIASLVVTYGAFLLEPQYQWILWTLLAVLVIALIGVGIYAWHRYRQQKLKNESEQAILLRQDKEIMRELFRLAVKETKNKLHNYHYPVYVMFGMEDKDESLILAQNDFTSVLDDDVEVQIGSEDIASESDSYLKFYQNENVFVIKVGQRIFDEDGADPDLWQELTELLRSARGQMACHGFLYVLGCDFIQTGDQVYHEQVMQAVREAIQNFNKQVGVEIPVFLALTKADAIKDFVPFFQTFADSKTDKALGFTIKNKDRKAFDFADYEAKSKAMIEYFSKHSMLFLKNVSEEKARSVLSFPYQMALFFNLLQENLRLLTKENKLKKSVWVHSLYFLVPNQQDIKYDLLSQLIASRADFATDAQKAESNYDKKRYFVQNFFSQAVLPFVHITGVNRRKKLTALIWYCVKLSVILFTLTYGFLFYYQNWCNYIAVREDVVQFVKDYNTEISNIDFVNNNSFDDIVETLNKLRLKSEELDHKFKAYEIVSYEQYHLAHTFKEFYHEQLKNVLLHKLELAVRHSLYNLETLDNNDVIYNGTGAYMMLFDKTILDEDYFLAYLDAQVLPNQYFNENARPALQKVSHDLFATDYDTLKMSEDEELIANLKQRMDAVSVEDMLYELIKLNKQNNYKVNFLNKFGKNFSVLFAFNPEYDGYNIPYMYTKEGFLSIDLSANSPELKRLLKNLKLVKANIDLSDKSIRNIIFKVQRKYYSEYVDYWMDLLNNINVNTFTTFDETKNALDKITAPHNGALETFMRVVVENTNLTNIYDQQADKEQNNGEEQADAKEEPKKTAITNKDKLNGAIIAAEFEPFYSFVGVDDKLEYSTDQVVPFNMMLKKLNEISSLYKQMDKSGNRAKNVFSSVTTSLLNDSSTFDLLSLVTDETPVLFDNILTSLAHSTTDNVRVVLIDYIRGRWNNTVVYQYNQFFRNKFPFDLEASNEVSISQFEAFFKHDGQLDDFFKKYLQFFLEHYPNGMLEQKMDNVFEVTIPSNILETYMVAEEIKRMFFVDDKASLQLKLTPRKLNGKSKLFEYRDGVSVCTYNQGPRLPCTVTWPVASNNDITVSFLSSSKSYNYGQHYNSEWGIIKVLLDPQNSSFNNIATGGTQSWIYKIDDYQMVYDVKVSDRNTNALSLDLFSKFHCSAW